LSSSGRSTEQFPGLSNLPSLRLDSNWISDISPLTELTSLAELYLAYNRISDISPLAGLTNLKTLEMGRWHGGNQISDISPLEGLTSLTGLHLGSNQISDIKPLVDNPGLGAGDTVWLRPNPLSEESINEHIPTLRARGVRVEY